MRKPGLPDVLAKLMFVLSLRAVPSAYNPNQI